MITLLDPEDRKLLTDRSAHVRSRNPHRVKDIVIASPGDVAGELNRLRSINLNLRPISGGGFQSWEETLTVGQIDGPPLANSTVELNIIPTASIYTLPANFWYVGRVMRFFVAGRVSTTGTPTLRFILRYGAVVSGVILVDSTALTCATLTNNTFWFRGNITCRSIGSGTAGTALAISEIVGITGATTQLQVPASAPAVTSGFDTTVATALNMSAIWGTASASNTLTVHEFYIEAIN